MKVSGIKYLLLPAFLLLAQTIFGQPDTIIVYETATGRMAYILPVNFDKNKSFDFTSSSPGSLATKSLMPSSAPNEDVFAGTDFSRLQRAADVFSIGDYPARSTIKLVTQKNDVVRSICSGMMVSENLVLASAHCVLMPGTKDILKDSLIAIPAYDQGSLHTTVGGSKISRYYLFKSYYDNSAFDDVVLLQTEEPIGRETGWVGIAFTTDPAYFSKHVLHKFSYPGTNPFSNGPVFNGDTLFYNYGLVSSLSSNVLGLKGSDAKGYPGQSGSSFFYTDNKNCYSFGTFSFSQNYRHYGFSPSAFYNLRNVIESYATDNWVTAKQEAPQIRFYPNPFTDHTVLDKGNDSPCSLFLYDMSGKLSARMLDFSTRQTRIDRQGLKSGIYIYRLLDESGAVIATGKLVAK